MPTDDCPQPRHPYAVVLSPLTHAGFEVNADGGLTSRPNLFEFHDYKTNHHSRNHAQPAADKCIHN
jgi:hypothetical protein